MFRQIEYRDATFQPAAVGSDETKALFALNPGERVVCASARAEIAAASTTDTTVTLGDGVDPDGYIAAIDLEATAAATLVNGQGALLNQSGGKMYTAADTVDVVYAGTTYGATNPKIRFRIGVVQEWD